MRVPPPVEVTVFFREIHRSYELQDPVMPTSPARRSQPRPWTRRRGSMPLFTLILLAISAGLGGIVWYYLRPNDKDATAAVLTTPVFSGPYSHVVLEQGTVESSSNIEIRCEVRSSGGTEIIWVIDEGEIVKRGEKLVELSTASLEQELVRQQIAVNTSRAMVVQAENSLEAAKIARTEYLEGTFRQEEQSILSQIFVAEENLRRAELAFQSTERLAARGIVRALQLEGDQFGVEKARNELEAAQTKLEVLRRYTKAKTLKQFDSDITIGEAKLESEQESHRLEVEKLEELREQIAACTILAPEEGQVIHANVTSGNNEFIVEPGAMVRENQVIIRLPDPNRMQVKATINESRISLVAAEMPATIRFDALPNEILHGQVVRVNQYAEPTSWRSGNIRQYAAFVRIDDPPPEVRSGMNAEVRIFVEREDEALQVPVQALYETQGHFFCLLKNGEDWETRSVQVGSSNDSFMTIDSGLVEGEQLVMNPRAFADKLQLPELTPMERRPLPGALATAREDNGPGERPDRMVSVDEPRGPRGDRQPAGERGERAGPPDERAAAPAAGGREPGRIFDALDANGDGVLSAAELEHLPAEQRQRILAADTDGDGVVTREEFIRAVSAMAGGRAELPRGEAPR